MPKLSDSMVDALRTIHNGVAPRARGVREATLNALFTRGLANMDGSLTTEGRAVLKDWNAGAADNFTLDMLAVLKRIHNAPCNRWVCTQLTGDEMLALDLLQRVQFIRMYLDAAGRSCYVFTRTGEDYYVRGIL